MLVSSERDPLLILTPVLASTNVHVIAKLSGKIPCGSNTSLTPGMVFCSYALKLFWKGKDKHSPEPATVCCHGVLWSDDCLV